MRHCYVLRVFTRGDTGGNHLGVVTDTTGLSSGAMQEIAAELGFSETVFVDWPEGSPPRVRIFTPGAEIPFAGHPLVGAAWVLGALGPMPSSPSESPESPEEDEAGDSAPLGIECGIGTIPFRVSGDRAEIDAPLVTAVREAPEGEDVASAGALPSPVGAWWVSMPICYLVLEVASGADIAAAVPDVAALAAGPSAEATYVFARDGGFVKARFFAPALGVGEDPATGSAATALAAVLARRGEASGFLTVLQGDEIGHPSTIDVTWSGGVVTLAGSVRRDEVRILDR
jgi:trans-2,3-dihydro-3-hydroxyanthranilate isomerase